jgi:LmbE family N-acetylglucosaminyl deacetylase
MSTKRLLGIFAHPDDEGLIGGALLHYNASGVETGLIYATRGDVGGISDPILAAPDNLGEVREKEARAAASLLGVQHLWFLDYRDSGMAGAPDNEHRRALIRVGAADAVGKLVEIIRQFRPQVIVTFDEAGGFGHPDHIAIYRYTTSAFHAAADAVQYPELGPAHAVAKLYYTSLSRRQMLMMAEWLQGQEYDNVLKDLDPNTLGLPDDQISVVLDVEQWNEMKERARIQHRSQLNPNTPIAGMPPELQRKWRSTESYQLATSRVGPDNPGENDLFAHVDQL